MYNTRRKEDTEIQNFVKEIYALLQQFKFQQNCRNVENSRIKADVEVIFQTIEGLHKACPDHLGDWYFTGITQLMEETRSVNEAFINFYEGKNKRAY